MKKMTKLFIFSLGIFASFSVLIFQIIITIIFPSSVDFISLDKIGYSMFLAILIEEFVKFIILWRISKNPHEQENIFVNSIIFGSGFAIAEIFLNILGNNTLTLELFFSYLGLFMLHTFTSMIYGLYFSREKTLITWQNIAFFTAGIFFHSVFNLGVFYEINPIFLDIALFFSLLFLLKLVFLPKRQK